MHRYAILSQDVKREELDQEFDRNVFELYLGAWVVATSKPTSSEVSDALQFHPDRRNGVVLKIGEFYGCHDEALWQKLDAWRDLA